MTDSTQRNTTTLTPSSDDQNYYTETPQGVNGEIKAPLLVKFSLFLFGFGLSILARLFLIRV